MPNPKMLIEIDTIATAPVSVYELTDSQIATLCELINVPFSSRTAFRLDLYNFMFENAWECAEISFGDDNGILAMMNFRAEEYLNSPDVGECDFSHCARSID
jgi:hypothetical protein